jgi:hypothetical protein
MFPFWSSAVSLALIAQASVESRDVGVLRRLACLDQLQLHALSCSA